MSKNNIVELIQLNNLRDLKHLVLIRNDTSGTIYLEEGGIHILEIKETSIVISAAPNICVEGHSLTLCIIKLPINKKITKFPKPGQFNNSFEIIGKVSEIKKDDNNKEFWSLVIAFTQYDVDSWEEFIISYIERQNSINKIKKII